MYHKPQKYILLMTALLMAGAAQAQQAFKTTATLDINNIKATSLVHGDMWIDSSITYPACMFPAASNKNIATAGGLWIAGYDNSGQLKAAAQTYRQNGNDYWPGPLDATNTTVTYTTSQAWARIWKINRTDIQAFLSVSSHTTANTPAAILEWPAKGNPYAKGNNNTSLTITTDMAPFVDVNGDGNYNALQGDYPYMKGDQTLWWVINDNGPGGHPNTQTIPFGFEIRNTAYGYKRNNLLDNVLFYEYDIHNRSGLAYDSLRVGLFADMDLRNPFDDYVAFDSAHRMGIVYNGMLTADTMTLAGVSLLDMPGDNCTNHAPAGSFTLFNNNFSSTGNPYGAMGYSNLLSSRFTSGTPLPNNSRYIFPDDPTIPGGYSECGMNDLPDDRRFVISTPSMHLAGNGSMKIVFAMIADSNSYNTCPGVNFTNLKKIADTAWAYYCTPPANTGIGSAAIAQKELKLYPNPAHSTITIEGLAAAGSSFSVYDAMDKNYSLPARQNGSRTELDIEQLAPGVYTILYRNGTQLQSGIFIKQ